ncbi:uncharacterized protein LOC124400094 [Silurus meridionalis]|uniref:uncharacterized protein LOC124400094 n=1 Tax=Silurus meridionalis TaxID=175797 RepID=UPI001EEC5C28|nr:uncharacterized protein LOC124400094 [Silurus meridionalis]
MTHTRRAALLFFLLVFFTGYVCGFNLSVWQTPRNITAVCGEHVNITCHFTLKMISTSYTEEWKVYWKKDNINETSNKLYNISDFNSDTGSDVNKSHTLKLHAVSVNHSGVYYCTVLKHIPKLVQFTDTTGTRLIVEPLVRNATGRSVESVMWTAPLALALALFCVVSVVCCKNRGLCRRGKKEGQVEQEDTGVVYAAVKLHKCSRDKTSQELREVPDAGCEGNPEVLYSDIHIKL